MNQDTYNQRKHFFIEDIADEDEILRVDIDNIKSKSMDYKAWNKLEQIY